MTQHPEAQCFHFVDRRLHCEEVDVAALADRHGTPLYVYSRSAMVERFDLLRQAFGTQAQICYAAKSNSNLSILRLFGELGAGFDLVSGGELRRLLAAGLDLQAAVFAGVAKDTWEIREALAAGILFFNLESPHELSLMQALADEQGQELRVAVRLNPDVDAGTHEYITTGRRQNKFGLDLDVAAGVVEQIAASSRLRLVGYHVHLGSQLRQIEPYLESFAKVEAFMDAAPVRREGLEYYDLGGGYGVSYGDGKGILDVLALGRELLPRLAARGLRAVLEPGRFLVADAGILVSRVLGAKVSGGQRYLLVDGAMNDLLRPSLYGAEHPIVPLSLDSGEAAAWDVVGPVCESADFLGRNLQLPELRRGDLLAVFAAGAYGFSMASNYNSRRRPAEILVDGTRSRLIRRREQFEDLWAEEIDL